MSDSVEPPKPEAPKRSAIDVIKEGSHDLRGTVAEELVMELLYVQSFGQMHHRFELRPRGVRVIGQCLPVRQCEPASRGVERSQVIARE